jgi:hypothetical protein
MDRVQSFIRAGVWFLVIPAVLTWCAIFFRWTALISAALLLLVATFSRPERRRLIFGVSAIVFVGLSLAPIDLRFRATPGPPRIVRYIHGLPTEHAREMARRGDAVLGGCIVSGYEPDWLIVW